MTRPIGAATVGPSSASRRSLSRVVPAVTRPRRGEPMAQAAGQDRGAAPSSVAPAVSEAGAEQGEPARAVGQRAGVSLVLPGPGRAASSVPDAAVLPEL